MRTQHLAACLLSFLASLTLVSAQQPTDIKTLDLPTLQKRAHGKDIPAAAELCDRFFTARGVDKDPVQAQPYCRKAAEGNDAHSQMILGIFYRDGLSVPKNTTIAATWFRKAAENGDAGSQFFLAKAYEEGNGVPQDYAEAVKWYIAAGSVFANARSSIPVDEFNLGYQFEHGDGRPKDYKQAVEWYRKAADLDDPDAETALGNMYKDGRGVPWSDATARMWLQKAAGQGNQDAKDSLAKMAGYDASQAAYKEPPPQPASESGESSENTSTQDVANDQADYERRLRQHREKVEELRAEVEAADAAAEEAEDEAQKAKTQSEETASNSQGALGALSVALSGTAQTIAEADAQSKRREADRLRDQLRELGEVVIQPPALRNSIEEGANRDYIAEARDRSLGNINTVAARNAETTSAPAHTTGASSTAKNFTYSENLPNGDIRKSTTTGVQGAYTITIQCFTHNGSAPYFTYSRNGPSDFFFNLPPCSGSPTVSSAPAPLPPSNTVAPPVPYQKPPSTGGTVVASGAVCPASGYTFTSYGDAAVGVPCTPGQPIAGGSGAGSGSGGSGGSSSGSSAGSGIKTTPALTNCLAQSYVDGDLTVTNTCNVPVYASWWINGHGGSWTLNPGEHTGTGYSSSDVAAGGASYYVCPKNASPTDSSGNALTGPVSSYVCVVRY